MALRDFCLIALGKIGGICLLEKAFSTDEYSKEDLQYMADLFKWVSYRTIWNNFDSCNNYSMPKEITTSCRDLHYWYGSREEKERKWDIAYFQKHFRKTQLDRMEGMGHAGMALKRPEQFAQKLTAILEA